MNIPFQTKHSTILTLAVAASIGSAFAAPAEEPELAPVIVTADRTARSADETLVPVSVVTRADIEREQARSLEDVLRGLPGVSLSNNGGPGKSTSLYLRGTNADHVLVLIDGVKMGSATLGSVALQDIPVDQIERIEIVRGPRASLYGSEAIGGVIQIFTRKGGGKLTPSFSLGAGSRSTANASAALSGGGEQYWFNASVAGEGTKGINAYQGTQPDRDGYRNESGSLRGGWRFSPGQSLELQALRVRAHSDFDDNYDAPGVDQNYSVDVQQLLSATYRFMPLDAWRSFVRLAQSRDESSSYKGGDFYSRFNTTRDMVTWQNDIAISDHRSLTAGIDYLRDGIDSDTPYDVRSRENKAGFAQYSEDFGALSAQLAGRIDDNQQFGTHDSGSFDLGYRVSDALRLRASYGTAFKAPSLNDLYYPTAGNPGLKPEHSRSTEFGASGTAAGMKWDASLYRTYISNLIQWAPVSPGSWTWIPSNVANATVTGLELTASRIFGDTRVALTTTFQNPKDHSGGDTEGNLLIRRSRQTARLDVDRDFGRWSFGSSLNGTGKRYDDTANSVKLGGYATLDLRGEYKINADWRVQARIENLLDKRYETAANYNQPGFGTFVTLRYQPK